MKGRDLFFVAQPCFSQYGLTQVSADMPGARPGVDYNIKTTTGKKKRQDETDGVCASSTEDRKRERQAVQERVYFPLCLYPTLHLLLLSPRNHRI